MAVQFAAHEIALPTAEDEQPVYEVGVVDESPSVDSGEAREETIQNISALDDWIFEGGSNSLVARTVGSAEGTRRWDGRKTMAYYGHVDPGNGVWNQGTFSYQHEAASPEEADEKQLRRLKRQERQLKEKAIQWQVPMSIEIRLNGLDLANQAPLAALDKGGYIERLAEAYREGKSGEQAIAWARTQAYFDPDKQAWDAPGLGNNHYSIRRDQERRMAAIDKALRAYNGDYVGDIAKLKDIHIDGVEAAGGSPLSGQSGHVADASFSPEAVTFEVPQLERTAEPIIAASSAVDSSASDIEVDSLIVANSAPNLAPDIETELAFEGDLVELGQWDEVEEAIASDTLSLVEGEIASADQAEEPVVDESGQAIASTDLGIELEQTYRTVEDELPIAATAENLPEQNAPEQTAEAQEAPSLDRLLKGVLPRAQNAPTQAGLLLPAPLTTQADPVETASEKSTEQKRALLHTEDTIVRPTDSSQ